MLVAVSRYSHTIPPSVQTTMKMFQKPSLKLPMAGSRGTPTPSRRPASSSSGRRAASSKSRFRRPLHAHATMAANTASRVAVHTP